jgi:hypothetical protein
MSTAAPPDRLALDGSDRIAWLIHDEADPYADDRRVGTGR